MNRVNFSDWQEMALKKDIEQIKKKTDFAGAGALFSVLGTSFSIRVNHCGSLV